MSTHDDRPARAGRVRGKWTALILALVVNLLFVAVLVFSVSWQNRPPSAVTAELYAPPTKVAPAPVPPQLQPLPQPRPQLQPLPLPKPLPPPPAPKPAPVIEKPDQREADIALKAKQAALQKQKQEDAERERVRAEQARKEAEAKKLAEQQARAVQAMRAQAQRESQLRAQAEQESQMRAQAAREAQARAQQAAAASAHNRAEADWIDRIRSKIRSYVIVPQDIQGNPEAVFDVVQLPTGEIIDVQLKKSSGVPAYDNAVQRAILKSSPLPRPATPDLFQRSLRLRFRPHDQ